MLSILAICGQYIDKTLKALNPLYATVNHIISVCQNSDPTKFDNLNFHTDADT